MDYELASSLWSYEPSTGIVRWKVRAGSQGRYKPGDEAGCLETGQMRWVIAYKGHRYYRARLAYLLMTGAWPPAQMDHRDTDPSNDAWDNLRPSSQALNNANRGAVKGRQYKGIVETESGTFRAHCGSREGKTFLGTFATAEEAARAYDAEAKRVWGEFARLNFPEKATYHGKSSAGEPTGTGLGAGEAGD